MSHCLKHTAQKAGQAFCEVTSFDVDDFLVDLYYYFDKSTKRKSELAEISDFCDVAYRKIIHHINVRWLSLQEAVDGALKQYPALCSMFMSKDESIPRFQKLKKAFADKITEVYLLCYCHVLQYFVRLNLFLQHDEPIIGAVREQILKFLKLLMSKFIPISAFRDVEVSAVDYKNRAIQLPDARLQIGLVIQQRVKSLLNSGDVAPVQVSCFFDGVKCFFVGALKYGLNSLPLNDPLLRAASFINFEQRANADPLHAEFFVNRFSDLLPYSSPSELTKLGEEFVDYQLLRDEDISVHVWNDARIEPREEGGNVHYQMDTPWHMSVF